MSTDRMFIGIDPGKSGAMAIFYGDNLVPTTCTYAQDLGYTAKEELKNATLRQARIFAVLEQVHSMPRQGVASTFSFGENFGWWRGVLDALSISHILVRPQKWKKVFGCTSDKSTSIAAVRSLFPDASLLETSRSRKPHDGIAEAILLAEYARRIYGKL